MDPSDRRAASHEEPASGPSYGVDRGLMAAQNSQINIQGNVNFAASPQLEPDIVQRLIESLRFDAMDERRHRVDEEAEGTCQWLLSTTRWLQWKASLQTPNAPRMLWIKGKAGAGKSTVMKFAVAHEEETRPDDEILLVHFFNARGTELERSAEGMYRTLLVQLLESLPDPKLDKKHLPKRFPQEDHWQLGRLKDLFTRLIRANGDRHITCFIDALDECDQEQARDMVEKLENLIKRVDRPAASLRICLASRYYPNISVPEAVGLDLPLEEQAGHQEDIARFIDQRVKIKNQQMAATARSMIQQKANGVFMWCSLVARILNVKHDEGKLSSEQAVVRALQEIPGELSTLYANILDLSGVSPDGPEAETLLCLQWVLFSRSESLEPLSQAIDWAASKDEDKKRYLTQVFDHEVMKTLVVHKSRGLVEVVEGWEGRLEVQVTHESVRDFLLKEGGLARLMGLDVAMPHPFAEARSHKTMRDLCAEAWLAHARGLHACPDFGLVKYALIFTLHHANEAQSVEFEDMSDFFESLRRDWSLWEDADWWGPEMESLMAPLTGGGFAALIRPLYRYQLGLAAADGDSIRRMLQHVAAYRIYVESVDWPPIDPMRALVEEHTTSMAQIPGVRCDLLRDLQSAIDWERPNDGFDSWPWIFCMTAWCDELATWFLVALVPDELVTDAQFRVAASQGFALTLGHIVRHGHSLLDDILFEGAKVHALCWAAADGREELAELLLQLPGLGVNTPDGFGKPALHHAIENHQRVMFHFLLSLPDVDVNAPDIEGNTPLMVAIDGNYYDAAHALLDTQRVDLTSQNERGETLLHCLAEQDCDDDADVEGQTRLTERLFSTGVRGFLNTQDVDGSTPLHCAISDNRPDIMVKLLLTEDTISDSLNARDRWGCTPLHIAAICARLDMVKMLLAADTTGGSLQIKNKKGKTPLQVALGAIVGLFPELNGYDEEKQRRQDVADYLASVAQPADKADVEATDSSERSAAPKRKRSDDSPQLRPALTTANRVELTLREV